MGSDSYAGGVVRLLYLKREGNMPRVIYADKRVIEFLFLFCLTFAGFSSFTIRFHILCSVHFIPVELERFIDSHTSRHYHHHIAMAITIIIVVVVPSTPAKRYTCRHIPNGDWVSHL